MCTFALLDREASPFGNWTVLLRDSPSDSRFDLSLLCFSFSFVLPWALELVSRGVTVARGRLGPFEEKR